MVELVEPMLAAVDEVGAGAELQAPKPLVGHAQGVGGVGQADAQGLTLLALRSPWQRFDWRVCEESEDLVSDMVPRSLVRG